MFTIVGERVSVMLEEDLHGQEVITLYAGHDAVYNRIALVDKLSYK